jgi:uncharacterized membrane protein
LGAGVMMAIVPGMVPEGRTRVLVIGAVMLPVPEYCIVVVTKAFGAGVITAIVPGTVPEASTSVLVKGAVIVPVPEY